MKLNAGSLFRFLAVTVVLLSASVMVSAYTLVMRDGRRVEIPDTFVVTNSMLTYEVSAGIQVTVQLAAIDVNATLRLNNDQRLTTRTAPVVEQSSRPVAATRTITNLDLENYRNARMDSEAAYEKRRQALGLPTVAEQQRQLEEASDRAREQAIKVRSNEAQSEFYWRQRASELRAELNATDARIQTVRRMLDETPQGYSFGTFSTFVPNTFGVSPFPSPRPARPAVLQPRSGGFNLRINAPLGTQGRIALNTRNRFGQRQGALLAIPFQQGDYGLDRVSLLNQLNELTIYRSGLQSRWRDLEEEARRAGAYPGWLRTF